MRFISFGAGVQSSALLLLSDRGIIDRADFAIFSDTGAEPQAVYDWLDFIRKKVTIPILVTNNGNLYKDMVSGNRFASIPFFTQDSAGKVGILRRQCTSEYKIIPVQRAMRELMGYKPRQRIKEKAEVLIGISCDEIIRMKPSRERWITNRWPLVEIWKSRQWCIDYVAKEIGEKPPRSACWFCPFHSDAEWKRLKETDADGWAKTIEVERKLQTNTRFRGKAFLHRSCTPIDRVDFNPDESQLDMFGNECEGMCGV